MYYNQMLRFLPLPSEYSPDTCCFNLIPCNMAVANRGCVCRISFVCYPKIQADGNTSAVTMAATTYLSTATAGCFTLGHFFPFDATLDSDEWRLSSFNHWLIRRLCHVCRILSGPFLSVLAVKKQTRKDLMGKKVQASWGLNCNQVVAGVVNV